MSVEYYLVCEKHKQFVWTCSDGFSGPLLQCDRSLAAFMITHRQCELSVLDEHELEITTGEHEEGYGDYKEWTNDNWKNLLRYDLDED